MRLEQAALRLGVLVLGCFALACAGTTPPPLPMTLENAHWTLVSLGAGGAPIAKTQSEPFLVFGPAPGRMSGSGGCNRLAGSYEQKGDKLTFGPIASTRMACAQGMEVEDALGTALSGTATLRIEGGRLELRDAAGVLLAEFQGHAGR